MNVQRRNLGFDPLGMTQQQIALLTRRLMPAGAVGLICPHIRDARAHRAQARQSLQRVDVVLAVPAGSTGTLGRALVPRLAGAGHTVRSLSRRPPPAFAVPGALPVPLPGRAFAGFRRGANLAPDQAAGTVTFEEFLATRFPPGTLSSGEAR